jgi:adenylylsulfate kinase
MDSSARSLAKAVSYRILGSLSTGAMVYLFTGDLKVSVGAGLLDSIIKIILYFLHERLWNHISFGRPRSPDYEI